MFNKNYLEEKLGYERWVLKDCILAVEQNYGVQSDSTFKFKKDSKVAVLHQSFAENGADKRLEILEKLSPLLFVTSFKVMDMIIEWVLEDNVEIVQRTFDGKIKQVRREIAKGNFKFPSLFRNENEIFEILIALYKQLKDYRNQIIHGSWGSNNSGNLSFLFENNKKSYKMDIGFKEIINLAESVVLIAELLTAKLSNVEDVIITVKFLFDKLSKIHKKTEFKITKPCFIKVEYELPDDETYIDLKIIENILKQSLGNNISYTLLVTTDKYNWSFPWSFVRDINEIKIDPSLEKYQM